ncbi:hypothetical protein [Moraxella lacunata]
MRIIHEKSDKARAMLYFWIKKWLNLPVFALKFIKFTKCYNFNKLIDF